MCFSPVFDKFSLKVYFYNYLERMSFLRNCISLNLQLQLTKKTNFYLIFGMAAGHDDQIYSLEQ